MHSLLQHLVLTLLISGSNAQLPNLNGILGEVEGEYTGVVGLLDDTLGSVEGGQGVPATGPLLPFDHSNDPNPLNLAVSPSCGTFSSPSYTDVGFPLSFSAIDTIVSFGDSWTTTGTTDGSANNPAIVVPPNPLAGGRASDGIIYTEWLSKYTSASRIVVKNYAVAGAVTDSSFTTGNAPGCSSCNDFVHQMDIFTSQGNSLDPATTLYTVFFGINDFYVDTVEGVANPNAAALANSALGQINRLLAAPYNAKNIVFFSSFFTSTDYDTYMNTIFKAFGTLRSQGINTAFVNTLSMFNAMDANPASFGLTNYAACLPDISTTDNACNTPNTYLFWQPVHQQTFTHSVFANYTMQVFVQCPGS